MPGAGEILSILLLVSSLAVMMIGFGVAFSLAALGLLFAALGGVVVIAVLVNLVELLCTAGLPALYTQVLSYYPLSDAGYYGYLALYNLAYVFDDALMVTIAVVTLGQHRLQERGGRWLKLLSGAVIVVLGALLLLAPEMLVF